MKIALVQDELVRKGGSEQVLLSFAKAFPNAPIYTLSYNSENTYPEFKNYTVKTSWFGKFIKSDKNLKRFFFPFGVLAMKQLNVKGYDIILHSTTHCAKYVKTDPKSVIITYCHTPFRLVYRPNSYDDVKNAGGLKSIALKFVINILKRIDQQSAKRTDYFLTNADEVVPRITEAYHPVNEIKVINPPVKCEKFHLSEVIDDYYLVVSRFEPYKMVDLVIKTFNNLPEKKLIIVGKGSLEEEYQKMAMPNIQFLQGLSSEELADKYAKCRALIFPQHEDYGITPLEAAASGRPVIAYGRGGILDTMIPVSNLNSSFEATAVFFYKQDQSSLLQAIHDFEKLTFDPQFILKHAQKFDEVHFIKKIKEFVNSKKNKDFE